MTVRLRCSPQNIEKYQINMPSMVFICVAQQHGNKCPKNLNESKFQLGRACFIDCRNPFIEIKTDTIRDATDQETYQKQEGA